MVSGNTFIIGADLRLLFANSDVHMSYLAADILVALVLKQSRTHFEASSITWSTGIYELFRFSNSSSGTLSFHIPYICATVSQLDII